MSSSTFNHNRIILNHNQTMIQPCLLVTGNHNQTVVQTAAGEQLQHNQTLVRTSR